MILGKRFTIVGRSRAHDVDMAQADHFNARNWENVDAAQVLGQGGWSLYSIEPERKCACFVRLPAGTDLSEAPFAYSTQFQTALEGMDVPMTALDEIAETWPKPSALTVILGPGRARSTLASAVLARQAGVWSLSEPDSFTNLARARARYAHDEMGRYIPAAVRLAYAPPDPTPMHFVLKPRSQATFFATEIAKAFPEAHLVYLYRDAVGWVDSMYKVGQRLGLMGSDAALSLVDVWNVLTGFCDPAWVETRARCTPDALAIEELLAMCWARNLEAARTAMDEGVSLSFVSHTALNADRPDELSAFFQACGVVGDVRRALPAFGKDSQLGSALAQNVPAKPLSDRQRASVVRMFEGAPDLYAPLPMSAVSDR